jgi:hypothetical protein
VHASKAVLLLRCTVSATALDQLLTLRLFPPAACRRVLCVPCGHMCLCSNCLPKVQAAGKCPLCRMQLQDLVQLF